MKIIVRLFILALALVSLPAAAQVACGDVIRSSRSLTADVHCPAHHWTALQIPASGVTLDLNGYTLSGEGSLGIMVGGNNVTIRGPGVIKGFSVGMQANDVSNTQVRDVVFASHDIALVLTGTSGARIARNQFYDGPGYAISVRGFDDGSTALPSTFNRIEDNYIEGYGTGINVCGFNASHLTIAGNELAAIVDYGIQLETGTNHNTIHNNRFYEMPGTAIRLSNASMNSIYSNYLKGGRLGIGIHDNAGSLSPSCAQPPMASVVTGNLLDSNTVIEYEIAFSLGLGLSASPIVTANRISNSKIYNNRFGIWFRDDAWTNESVGNAFTGTRTPIVDSGTGNIH